MVGVDLSNKMIELATAAEQHEPLGIEYLVEDARNVRFGAAFDLVLAAYLLNYARSEQDLLGMAAAIHASLKPGGRFITVNINPNQQVRSFGNPRKYGFVKTAATHTSAFNATGFTDVHWHTPEPAPAECNGRAEYWTDFFRDPPIALLTCRKREPARHQFASV